MVLEWREREHKDVEEVVRGDLMAQQALRACGLGTERNSSAWGITTDSLSPEINHFQ